MRLYNYNQNNSGGRFEITDNLTTDVLIEADRYEFANIIAEDIGIEFYTGCPCCGDRWSKAYDDEVDNYSVFEFPDKESAIKYFQEEFTKSWYRDDVIIHFKDGSKEKVILTKERVY